jgi:hypothetical protein
MNGGAGVDVMLGEIGNDTFFGGEDVNYLFLGPGGANDNDMVVVFPKQDGPHVVYEFEPGGTNDSIQLSGTEWTTLSQVISATTDYSAAGGYMVITLDADTNIWLIGVRPSQLTASDFSFVFTA